MPSNKPRLYIALYPSGVVNNEERKYHWSFLIGPKTEKDSEVPGTRYHVKNTPFGWTYEELALRNVKSTINLLARIVIAKVEDQNRLAEIFRNTPVTQNDPNWRCRTWVKEVLSRIAQDGKAVGSAELDWDKIEGLARGYVGKKTAEGRYAKADELLLPKPTWDMLERKEVVS